MRARLLLDTHAALWFATVDGRLSEPTRSRIRDAESELLLSSVVVLEIAIKRFLGKLEAPQDLIERFIEAGARPLPIGFEHAAAVEHLPWHHRDPFDRLLVAQVQIEGAVLVSGDPAFAAYGVPVLW